MKRVLCIACIFTCCLFGTAALAEEVDVDQRLKKLEDKVQDQSKTIEEQQKTIDSLKENNSKQKDQAPQQKGQAPQENQDLQQKVQELNEKVDQVVETQKKEIMSIFNPSIGLVGETIFSYSSKGSTATGSDRPLPP